MLLGALAATLVASLSLWLGLGLIGRARRVSAGLRDATPKQQAEAPRWAIALGWLLGLELVLAGAAMLGLLGYTLAVLLATRGW
jgi:hypothetical protein